MGRPMDSNNYVAPYGDGWIVVIDGKQVGDIRPTQRDAEMDYERLTGTPSPVRSPAPPVSPPASVATPYPITQDTTQQDLLPIQQMQHEIDLLNQEYLRMRAKLLDIPDMYMRNENDRHKIALDAATAFAQQSGWLIPGSFIENMIFQNNPGIAQTVDPVYPGVTKPGDVGTMPNTGVGKLPGDQVGALGISGQDSGYVGQIAATNPAATAIGAQGTAEKVYNTPTGKKTIAQMRQELKNAGSPIWESGSDEAILADYARTTNGPVTPVDAGGGTPAVKKWKQPDGQVKTIDDIKAELKKANWDGNVDTASEAELIAAFERTIGGKLTLVGDDGTVSIPTPPVDWTVTPPATQYPAAPGSAYDQSKWMPTLEREKWWFDKQKYLTDLAANPANLTQTLLMLGMSPDQVSSFLTSSPSVNYLLNQGGWDVNLDPGAPSPYWDKSSGLPITPGSGPTPPGIPAPGGGGGQVGIPGGEMQYTGPPIVPGNNTVSIPPGGMQYTGPLPVPEPTYSTPSMQYQPPQGVMPAQSVPGAEMSALGNAINIMSQPQGQMTAQGGPSMQAQLNNPYSQYGQVSPNPSQHPSKPGFTWADALKNNTGAWSYYNRWRNYQRQQQQQATVQPIASQGGYYGPSYNMNQMGVQQAGQQPIWDIGGPPGGQMPVQPGPYVPQPIQNAMRTTPLGDIGTRNPNFPFITGRQLPVRNVLNWLDTNNPMLKVLQGLFSYSGQDPANAFAEFQSFLPKGAVAGATNYM